MSGFRTHQSTDGGSQIIFFNVEEPSFTSDCLTFSGDILVGALTSPAIAQTLSLNHRYFSLSLTCRGLRVRGIFELDGRTVRIEETNRIERLQPHDGRLVASAKLIFVSDPAFSTNACDRLLETLES